MTSIVRPPFVVGLYSPAQGSGKTTVAQQLREKYGFEIVSFAGPLKEMAHSFLISAGVQPLDAWTAVYGSPAAKEQAHLGLNGKTARHVMQTIGTEWGRKCIGEDIWISIAEGAVRRAWDKGCPVVIDDVRFPNEHQAITQVLGGAVYKVHRPVVRKNAHSKHASEGALDHLELPTIRNYTTIPDLARIVDDLVMTSFAVAR